MRSGLRLHEGRRIPFVGRVERYATKDARTHVLITDIFHADTGEFLADHNWLSLCPELDALHPREGDILCAGRRCAIISAIRQRATTDCAT